MSLNLRHAWANDGPNSWSNRKKAVTGLLADRPADILAFQEVNASIFPFLRKNLPNHLLLGDEEPRGEFWEYRPIFVPRDWPVEAVETISLSKTPRQPSKSWSSRFVRQATRALVLSPAGSLTVYNTHLDFDDETRLNQARVLWDWIAENDRDRPVILCGDFNTTPDQSPYRLLTEEPGDFENAAARPFEATYHHFTGQNGGQTIDWILYRGGIKVAQPARVVRHNLDGVYPSDHFPLLARLSLPNGGAEKSGK